MTKIEEARLLLPWYVTQRLDELEHKLVEEALVISPLLRREVDEQRQISKLIANDESVLEISAVNTAEHRLDDLFERIDEFEMLNPVTPFPANATDRVYQ